jgi:hypothetical protein
MDFLNHEQIRSLLESCVEPAVSIYMPTHRGGAGPKQDPIRLKNAITEARQRLTTAGYSYKHIETMLQPCRELLEDSSFWQKLSDGLAVFLDDKGLRYFRLPCRFEPLVAVDDKFHVRPLLPFVNRNGEFYLLALSERRVRLFRGNVYGLQEVELVGVPRSMEEAFQYDEAGQPSLQGHARAGAASASSAGPHQGMFHGHGGAAETVKEDRARFIRVIDRALNRMLKDKSIPLVLACIACSQAVYREINSYPRLLDAYVQGSPDHWDNRELWQRSWPLVEQARAATLEEATRRYLEMAHTDMAGDTIEEVTPRAYEGRVDVMIVAVDGRVPGVFDPRTLTAAVHAKPQLGDRDLLEFTTSQTLLHAGAVYAVEAGKVPSGRTLAATYRY